MKISEHYSFSDEAIQHQVDTSFTNRLDSICGELLAAMAGGRSLDKGYKKLSDLIYERFNIRCIFGKNAYIGPSVVTPDIVGVLSQSFGSRWLGTKVHRKNREVIIKALKSGDFYIDYANGKISNIPGLRIKMFAGVGEIASHTNNERVLAGAILHEVGHVFDYFDSLSKLYRRGNDSRIILESVINGKFNAKKTIKLLDTSKDDEVSTELLSANRSGNGIAISKAVANALFKTIVKDASSSQYYRVTVTEVAADSFSARFGYSKENAVGLATIHRKLGEGSKNEALVFYFTSILRIKNILVTAINTQRTSGINMWLGYLVLILLLYSVYKRFIKTATRSSKYKNDPYLVLEDRLKFLKREYINRVTLLGYDKDDIQDIVASFDEIDNTIKNINKNFKWLSKIAYKISTSANTEETYIKFEQMLQDLANNNLTVSALNLELSLMDG